VGCSARRPGLAHGQSRSFKPECHGSDGLAPSPGCSTCQTEFEVVLRRDVALVSLSLGPESVPVPPHCLGFPGESARARRHESESPALETRTPTAATSTAGGPAGCKLNPVIDQNFPFPVECSHDAASPDGARPPLARCLSRTLMGIVRFFARPGTGAAPGPGAPAATPLVLTGAAARHGCSSAKRRAAFKQVYINGLLSCYYGGGGKTYICGRGHGSRTESLRRRLRLAAELETQVSPKIWKSILRDRLRVHAGLPSRAGQQPPCYAA
jgi:hypothetical protein